MKKSILAFTSLLAVCAAALGQGKVLFENDSLHLVYFNPDPTFLLPGDGGLAGKAVGTNPTPSGVTFTVGLYASLSSSTLSLQSSLQSTISFNPARGPGLFGPTQLLLTGIPGDVTAFFQVWVWDSAYPNPMSSIGYIGASPIFTMVPSSGLLYNSIVNPLPPANSTWNSGPYPLDQYGAGSRGALEVTLIPEPEILALVGLGMTALWIGRHLKKRP